MNIEITNVDVKVGNYNYYVINGKRRTRNWKESKYFSIASVSKTEAIVFLKVFFDILKKPKYLGVKLKGWAVDC